MDKFKLFGRILRSINFKLNRLKLIPYGKYIYRIFISISICKWICVQNLTYIKLSTTWQPVGSRVSLSIFIS